MDKKTNKRSGGLQDSVKVPDVHILVTCRKEELKEFSLLVFKTIRVGFPTAKIHVYLNNLDDSFLDGIEEHFGSLFATVNKVSTIHHKWIEMLIKREQDPFWIVDTDMIFYGPVENWKFETPLAGYKIPEFVDPFTGCITRSRLHTSLMYIDPVRMCNLFHEYSGKINQTDFNPLCNFIYPLVVPFNGKPYFNDTMSMAYHAIGGTEFTPEQKDAYFHFHFGTLEDIVLPFFEDGDSVFKIRKEIVNNPELGRFAWNHQDAYFIANAPVQDGVDVLKPPTKEEAAVSTEWKDKLCCGDKEAMRFCDLWYGYIHSIDDLVDTVKDNRPTMSKQQMISIFFQAAILYNNTFYKANQALLFPLILDITNSYTTSVLWETSPMKHRRHIADILRMAGNRMYTMVALICGGEEHSQAINQILFEKDWLLQHNSNGEPI